MAEVGPRPRRRIRRLLKGMLAASAALLLLAVALEVGLRLFAAHPFGPEGQLSGLYQNDGETSYRLSPGWQGEMTVDGRTVRISVNALGMRSPEIPPRASGQLRVLCLGDSFVFGYGVQGDEAFPSLLTEELDGSVDLEVVTGNAGVIGHGTVDMVRVFEHHREPFDPDVVVAAIYLGNDFVDDFVLTKIMVRGNFMAGPVMPGEWARVLQTTWRGRLALSSRLAMEIEQRLLGTPLGLQAPPTPEEAAAFAGFPPEGQRLPALFMDAVDEAHFRDEATGSLGIPRVLARVEESLGAIQRLAGDTPVLVLFLPTPNHTGEDTWAGRLTGLGFDPTAFRYGLTQQRLQAICARLQLPSVDLTETIRQLDDPQTAFLPENKHLSVQGHRLAARRLAEQIKETLGR